MSRKHENRDGGGGVAVLTGEDGGKESGDFRMRGHLQAEMRSW